MLLSGTRAGFVAALCLSALLFGCGHDRSTFYRSLADADKAGEMNRGWIPDFLPKSSRSIRQVYDLSPSREWCEFEFQPGDSQALRDNLKEVQTPPAVIVNVPNPHVSWWPELLEGNLDGNRIRALGFRLYVLVTPATSVTTETWLFAIDSQKGHAFFYAGPD